MSLLDLYRNAGSDWRRRLALGSAVLRGEKMPHLLTGWRPGFCLLRAFERNPSTSARIWNLKPKNDERKMFSDWNLESEKLF